MAATFAGDAGPAFDPDRDDDKGGDAGDEPDLAVVEAYLDIVERHGCDAPEAVVFRVANAGDAGLAALLADVRAAAAAARRRELVRRLGGCLNVMAVVTLLFAVGLACWWWGVRYERDRAAARQPAPAPAPAPVTEETP